jgi:prepilin-type N-terminal cleavage/methylation domain-containing protein
VVIRRLLNRLPRFGDERGFTLIELVMASSVGLVILGSATLITTGAARHNGEVANRTDATQRGRLAMERMERLLRSQVCTTASAFPVASARATDVTFYADLSDGSSPVVRHTLSYDPATKRLTDTAVSGNTATPIAFTAAPVVTELASDVVPDDANPVFRYYAYPASAPATGALEPNVELVPSAGASLSDTEVGQIARIDLNFVTTGATRTTQDIKAEMTNQVFVRLADPNDASSFNPSCT